MVQADHSVSSIRAVRRCRTQVAVATAESPPYQSKRYQKDRNFNNSKRNINSNNIRACSSLRCSIAAGDQLCSAIASIQDKEPLSLT